MKEVIKIPQLRFPEFKVVQPWTKFGEVVSSNIYGPRFNANDYSESGNVRTIRGTDVDKNGEFKYEQVPVAMLDQKTIDNHKLEDGDLVMITTADCGLTGVFRKQNMDYISSAYGVRIRLNTKANPEYFKYFFQTRHAKREIISYERKATVSNLPGSDILKIKINLPQIDEQTKIANFLTTVDKRIKLLTQKKEKLEQYKKGIMQQIFSQQLRFKDENGKDYPEWEEKRLGNICEKHSSNISAINLTGNDGIYKIYGATGYLQNVDFYLEEEPYISIVKDGAGVGRVLICESESSVLGTLDIIKPKEGIILYFLFTILSHIPFNKYVTGSTIPHIYFKDYSKEFILVPTPSEQQKIASFLSNLDQKISLVNQQIDLTRKWKQGLLQKMFV